MKMLVLLLTFVVSLLLVCPAQAQFTVYDDFSGPFVSTDRWFHRNLTNPDGDVWWYEGGFRIVKGKLNYYNRAYGDIRSNTDTDYMRRELFLRNASDVIGMETLIQVAKNGHQIVGCSNNNAPSETRIFMGGSFFNNGDSSNPSNSTGDIMAYIGLFKYSDLGTLPPGNITIPPGYMGVRARVQKCTNPACTSYEPIHETLFNNLFVKIGQKVMLRITWNQPAHTFTFQVGKKVVETYNYSVDIPNDTNSPILSNKRLEVAHWLANCTQNRTIGWADVLFDYVAIQQD